ncbi:HAD-IA family hydrolase [Jeotgalibacillus sp. JSM ZJ347]|uniref:HAD-IA family hydrolase n=1 Tax=Jeotgalibacillus sp. JSM ZJ347 TaxID=3342117 RepID=UPI0035A82280
MIKCMILDFDGLVIDTETSEIESFEKLYETYQVQFPVKKWLEGIGSALSFDPYESLMSEVPGVKREELRPQWAQVFELNITLASSSSKRWIDRHMEQLDIRQYFDFICTADDVEHVKPEPDLYLKVLAHFNIKSHEAVVFEDSPNGALAAIRAGIQCVAVPNPTTESLGFDPGIALRLSSKEEMSLDEVLSKI